MGGEDAGGGGHYGYWVLGVVENIIKLRCWEVHFPPSTLRCEWFNSQMSLLNDARGILCAEKQVSLALENNQMHVIR